MALFLDVDIFYALSIAVRLRHAFAVFVINFMVSAIKHRTAIIPRFGFVVFTELGFTIQGVECYLNTHLITMN